MCCCSVYIATIVAGVLGIFQAFASLCWNVPLLISLSINSTRSIALAPVDTTKLNDVFIVYGITAVFAFLNVQLLIFSGLMLKGNSALRTEWISAWFILINLKTVLYGIVGVYFFYKYGTVHPTRINAYFRLGALFSGIFFFWPSVNLALSCMVCKRIKDIESYNSSIPRSCPDSSHITCPHEISITPPPPYTETGTFTHSEQNQRRPHVQFQSQTQNLTQVQPQNQSGNIQAITNSVLVTGWSEAPLLDFEEQPVSTIQDDLVSVNTQ